MNEEITNLYTLYGFEVYENTDNYIVFTHTNGYFCNAEIVLIQSVDVEELCHQLTSIGFSVRTINFVSITDLHEKLFDGFFSKHNSKIRIKNMYEKYCAFQRKKLLCEKYEYLNCDYIIPGENSSKNIVDTIMDKLTSEDAQLIILEAAAGYGKTCTSYEVLSRFTNESIDKVPLMTELSKNRKAAIFRYVLLSEIDNQFSSLSQKLVEYEIRSGKVPLIIDGFDELLSKSTSDLTSDQESIEDAQGMLDTIVDLLTGDSRAKILITSRKSAIFTGEKFDDWMESHELCGKTIRIELKYPAIKDWLTTEKIDLLKNKSVNLSFISNPIILSILKSQTIEEIKEKSVNDLIEEYIKSVFEREKERQGLVLSPEEQENILAQVAKFFVEFDISSEEDEFVKYILGEILSNDIDEYIKRYSTLKLFGNEDIPNEEEFIMKLLHNAFLDRPVSTKNTIGFINDFSFGYFIGLAIIKGYISKTTTIKYKYADLLCTTFSSNEMSQRQCLCDYISQKIDIYSIDQQLTLSDKMFHKTLRIYTDATICNLTFSSGFDFSDGCQFNSCTFINCVFDNCIFGCNSFQNVSFYNCIFYNLQINGNKFGNDSISFYNCSGHEDLSNLLSLKTPGGQIDISYERIVLEQFWKKGSDSPEVRRAFTTVSKGVAPKDLCFIEKAIESLIHKGIIIKRSVCYELNFNQIAEIRAILGR